MNRYPLLSLLLGDMKYRTAAVRQRLPRMTPIAMYTEVMSGSGGFADSASVTADRTSRPSSTNSPLASTDTVAM